MPSIAYSAENRQIKFKWNFISLSEIVETILLLNETSGRTEENYVSIVENLLLQKILRQNMTLFNVEIEKI